MSHADVTHVVAWLRASGATRLTTDSRNIVPSDERKTAFIAWPGAAVDGRAFIPSALQNGAVAALMEADGKPENALQANQDKASTRSYAGLKAASGHIAAQFYDQPSHHLNIVAFTGTNGKTSSSWWLAEALSALPAPDTQKCAVVGTLGTGLMGAIDNNGLTTPDPVLLQDRLKAFMDKGCKAVSLEASSIGIAEGRLNGTRIHTAVLTNFTQDHLDYHGSMASYWQAKAALFDWPDLQAAVINLDDPKSYLLQGKAPETWTYSIDAARHHIAPRIFAKHITTTAQGLAFDVVEGAESHRLQTTLIGRYNVSNLLGVIAAMRSLGVPLSLCIKACAAITPVSGRLEVVSSDPQPLVVIDYAHTPDALEKVLLALRELTVIRGGKLWCVFGCGGHRDHAKRPMMGAVARSHADKVVVTSDNPRGESPNSIIAHILLGTGESPEVQVQADRALAISETIAQTQINDVVVIAGKGHEDYQEIAGVKHSFSDQAHAKAALVAWSAKP
ncbi:MAG: UDP-N-acetylmuramoyl-L-alanyl-D-glutamate--2,6-diaminopimelate ligase [Cytophagales bacterium]|nr:UDP-N-acetylmuramoyl-L-alanyl-D-glutamate--2,6-diaminopimelate ligase [Cytophagales bacterium]